MFHASSLHGPDVDMLIEILNAISNIGHRVDASLTSTVVLSSSTHVPIEADGEERNIVMTDYRESSKMDSLEQGIEPSSDSLVGYAELLLPSCVSKVASLLETVLQNGVVLQLFTLPLLSLSITVSPSIPIAFKNFTPQHSASLALVVFYTDYQSRSHLLQWFALCFELCNFETTKEPPLSCRLIQTLVSRVFTTIISGPQYF
ncbi:hypothetical protein RchiOBHm_Chr7g0182321 [Rosa chinensis]|uniref:Uncharacterized protein n=1 Tax=Rosa chinensis TaxID=74649 RepID=A0A2P6P2V9_ROSCH|nr:hypothetical protein RchiOBHm_Chr7g0182321 [Rosa chinensis]